MNALMVDAVFLVGFMGSGKSEVGRGLARRLDWTFVDLDEEIAREANCTIPEIFAREGEAGFRCRERAALLRFLSATNSVISCGGGIVTQPENLADLLAQPGSVCLRVSPEEAWRRIGQDPNRPLMQTDHPRERIQNLLSERTEAYAAFPRQIQTDGFRPSEVIEQVLSELRK